MKKIAYTNSAGGLEILHPVEGARLAYAVLDSQGKDIKRSATPVAVDTLLRGWPVEGATAEWAETEDEFVARIRQKDVPAGAVGVQVIDTSIIPSDRTHRRAWRLNAGVIEVDANVVQQLKDADAIKAIDGVDRLQFEHLFRLENRTRVLEGKLQITKAQYRDALIAEWKTLNP